MKPPISPIAKDFHSFIQGLQDEICSGLEREEPDTIFQEDIWNRVEGGGGRTRVLESGSVIEKGGVNISAVWGDIPDPIKPNVTDTEGQFYATGISLVIHPFNPFAPTVHANIRFFELFDRNGTIVDQWFGGGLDLTPYYLFTQDAIHFHSVIKQTCDQFDATYYPRFKKECDSYFFNHHRGEARGIGGIFFDHQRPQQDRTLSHLNAFTKAIGSCFLDAYLPILRFRKGWEFNEQHKSWQEIRRGRYVEFNLIHDRGTIFGLKSNGRIESILMSLPPTVRWNYNAQPKPHSAEAELLSVLTSPKNWIPL